MRTTYSDVIDQYNHVVTSDLELIQPLISANQPRIIKDNGVFRIEPGEIVIIVEGIIAIEVEYNVGFGSAIKRGARSKTLDMLQIGKGIRGMIFGIIESYGPALSLKYTAKKNVKIVTCSKEAFEHYFIQRDRFAYLMEIMAFQLSLIIDAHHEKNLPSRYDTIKSMIYRYKKQQDAGVLHDRSLASFILKRTKMSRSYLFKILAELKEGDISKWRTVSWSILCTSYRKNFNLLSGLKRPSNRSRDYFTLHYACPPGDESCLPKPVAVRNLARRVSFTTMRMERQRPFVGLILSVYISKMQLIIL